VIVIAMVERFKVDFIFILIDEIHERAFKATTTLPFLCLIFQLCWILGYQYGTVTGCFMQPRL